VLPFRDGSKMGQKDTNGNSNEDKVLGKIRDGSNNVLPSNQDSQQYKHHPFETDQGLLSIPTRERETTAIGLTRMEVWLD